MFPLLCSARRFQPAGNIRIRCEFKIFVSRLLARTICMRFVIITIRCQTNQLSNTFRSYTRQASEIACLIINSSAYLLHMFKFAYVRYCNALVRFEFDYSTSKSTGPVDWNRLWRNVSKKPWDAVLNEWRSKAERKREKGWKGDERRFANKTSSCTLPNRVHMIHTRVLRCLLFAS